MSNAATKIILAASAGLAMLTSCGPDRHEKEASALVAEARTALDTGNCRLAHELADSVGRAYPKALEARREALHISTLAREGLAIAELEATDSLLASLAWRSDSLKPYVRRVDNPVEPYFVAAGENSDKVYSTTGIYGRLSPEGDFYILAVLAGHTVKAHSVSVQTASGEGASTARIPHDGERNDRGAGRETITFLAAECDSLARFVSLHSGEPMTLVFNGTSGTHRTALSPEASARLATLYDYASAVRQARVASVRREKLSRSVDLSRQQAARTYVEPEEEK